jgi:MerR family transcriptional regulator, copper efflux regulator
MNIGEAAALAGMSAKMIRYYERTGLIVCPARASSGYRVYTEREIHTLKFIRRSRDLGFSVAQIECLLALWRNHDRASADVRALALEHIDHLCKKVSELEAIIAALRELADRCMDDDRPECPILRDLSAGGSNDRTPRTGSRFGVTRLASQGR